MRPVRQLTVRLIPPTLLCLAYSASYVAAKGSNTIIRPEGGWQVTAGTIMDIAWTDVSEGPVNLFLVPASGNDPEITLGTSLPNTGFATVNIPSHVPTNQRYQIRIEDDDDPSITHTSTPFTPLEEDAAEVLNEIGSHWVFDEEEEEWVLEASTSPDFDEPPPDLDEPPPDLDEPPPDLDEPPPDWDELPPDFDELPPDSEGRSSSSSNSSSSSSSATTGARTAGETARPAPADKPSPGSIAAIVIGTVLATCLVIGAVILFVWQRRRKRRKREGNAAAEMMGGAGSRPTHPSLPPGASSHRNMSNTSPSVPVQYYDPRAFGSTSAVSEEDQAPPYLTHDGVSAKAARKAEYTWPGNASSNDPTLSDGSVAGMTDTRNSAADSTSPGVSGRLTSTNRGRRPAELSAESNGHNGNLGHNGNTGDKANNAADADTK